MSVVTASEGLSEANCAVCGAYFLYVRRTKPRNRCDEHRGARIPKAKDPARIPHRGRGDRPAHWERKRPASGPVKDESSGSEAREARPGAEWPGGGFTFDDWVSPDRYPLRHFAGADRDRAEAFWSEHGRLVFHGAAGTGSCGVYTIGSWRPRPLCRREYGRSLVPFVRHL